MSNLSNLPETQAIGFAGRGSLSATADGVWRMTNAAGNAGAEIVATGSGSWKPLQSGNAEPTTDQFPSSGDWGLYLNTTTDKLRVAYNDSGTIREVTTSNIYYNPLDYYQVADGPDFALCFDRCFRAMETPVDGKLLVCKIPYGSYTFLTTANLPQTSDADIAKLRLMIDGAGASIINGGFDGPLFARTSGTPTPNSLYYTIANFFGKGNATRSGTYNTNYGTSNFPVSPTTDRSFFKLSNCDGVRITNCHGMSFHVGLHLIGTKDFYIDHCMLNECASNTRLEPDSNGRICSEGLIEQCRSGGGASHFRVDYWCEETDNIVFDQTVTEQGSALASYAWICNDNTTCKRLTIRNAWMEYTQPFWSQVYVQNNAEDAMLLVEHTLLGYSAIKARPSTSGNLTVKLFDCWNYWQRAGIFSGDLTANWDLGRKTITDITDDGENALVTCDSDHSWKEGQSVVISGTTNYNGTWIINDIAKGQLRTATLSAPFVVNETGISASGKALWADEGSAIFAAKDSPITTSTGKTVMHWYMPHNSPGADDEPYDHWHPGLSGGSLNYYPLGSRVYYRGEIFESAIAQPSVAPTPGGSNASWTLVGDAKWMPLGQYGTISTSPTEDANYTGGNPREDTLAGNIIPIVDNMAQVDPLLGDWGRFFDNHKTPPGYFAQGYSMFGGIPTWWQVANGTQVF